MTHKNRTSWDRTKKTLAYGAVTVVSIASVFAGLNYYFTRTETNVVLANENHVSPTPTVTPSPSLTPTPEPIQEDITVKISHYNPELGGVNCGHFVNGKCVSHLANGESWEKYIDTKNVIACPQELRIGTKIKILGRVWVCRDRGGKITKTESGAYWVDMLTRDTVIPYGHEVEAKIIK